MSMARIALIGLSYRSAPISVREQLACPTTNNGRAAALLGTEGAIAGRAGDVQEIVLLSTCNRVELYAAVGADVADVEGLLAALLAQLAGVPAHTFAGQTYFHTGLAASNHLLRVTAGLDSLVFGESQVQGQVTAAYMDAVANKAIGPVLTELFRTAIRTGKRARNETAISRNPVSTSSVAIIQAHRLLGRSTGNRYLVIGVGEMGRLALKRLYKADAAQIGVINRTFARTTNYVCGDDMVAYRWEEMAEALIGADIVISATSAPDAIIDDAIVRSIMARRPERPLVVLDIAVPRDVEPAVGQIPGVHLVDADHLQNSLDEALAARQAEAPRVEAIIGEELAALAAQLRALAVKPVIVELRAKAERIRQEEMGRVLGYLGDADAQTVEQLHFFSRALINKLLHEPTVRLKNRAGEAQAGVYAAALNELFALDEQV